MQQSFSFLHTDEKVKPEYSYSLVDVVNHIASVEHPVLGFDIETEGLNQFDRTLNVLSIAFVWKEGNAYKGCCILHKDFIRSLPIINHIFKQKKVTLVGHNIKFDLNWCREKLGSEFNIKLFDTFIAAYLVNENAPSNALDTLVNLYLPGEYDAEEYAQDKRLRSNIGMLSDARKINYNCKDAEATLKLAGKLWTALRTAKRRKLAVVASNIQNTISRIETDGVYIDFAYAGDREARLMQDIYQSVINIQETVGNFVKPDGKDLVKTLKHLGANMTVLTNKGEVSTETNVLKDIKSESSNNLKLVEVIDNVLVYRKATKLYGTYYKRLRREADANNRYHITYQLGKYGTEDDSFGGTVTGRLSSPMQNSPRDKEFRGMFAAPNGTSLIDGDFSQLELRVAAFEAQEPLMIEAFQQGLDIHTAVMADLLGYDYDELCELLEDKTHKDYARLKNLRVAIKRINFGILYGVAKHRLQTLLKYELGLIWDLAECDALIKRWLARYTKVDAWIKRTQNLALKYKYVEMSLGQRRHLPDASMDDPIGRRCLRQATNFPIQSFASWICLLGMNMLDQYFQTLDVKASVVLQVHDSVTSQIDSTDKKYLTNVESCVRMIMERETINALSSIWGINFNVPLEFKTVICERWS